MAQLDRLAGLGGVAALAIALTTCGSNDGGGAPEPSPTGTAPGHPSPGSLDRSFSGGVVTTPHSPLYESEVASAVAIQPDGRIVVGGTGWEPSERRALLMRYDSDGRLDQSFGAGGGVSGPGRTVEALTLQSDGKILTAGVGVVARHSPDGSLDSGFGSRGWVVSWASGIALQAEDRIILADHTSLSRLRLDGSLDRSFGREGVAPLPDAALNTPRLLGVHSDGRIVTAVGYENRLSVLGLLPYGVSDSAGFGDDGVVSIASEGYPYPALALQPDGRIVLAATVYQSGSYTSRLIRLGADGRFDGSFGSNGVVNAPFGGVASLAVQADGKIVAAGSGAGLVRYHSDGRLDTSFGTRGRASVPGDLARVVSVAIQQDGRIVVAGSAGADILVARYWP